MKLREGAKFLIRGNFVGGGYSNRTPITVTGQVGYSKDNLIPFIVVTEGGGHLGLSAPHFVPLNMPWAYGGGGGYSGGGHTPSIEISIWTEPPPGREPEEATDSREGIDWQRRVGAVHPGTKRYIVEALLPRYSAPLQKFGGMSLPKITTLTGGKTGETYWVAENWRVSVSYTGTGAPEDQVTPIKLEREGKQ